MRETMKIVWVSAITAGLVAGILSLGGIIIAGDLDPSAPPGPTMKTLDEIPPTWSQQLDSTDGDPVTSCNSSRFECVMNDEAVLDKETGLVWELRPSTTPWDWNAALHVCWNLRIDNHMGWRLPTPAELSSLIDTTHQEPALPWPNPFRQYQSEWDDYYWSSATHNDATDHAHTVSFFAGSVGSQTKTEPHYFWCVRGGSGQESW
ncbi:DUF1566 domain-containing protein [Thermodesulfobacteriota bacterium]